MKISSIQDIAICNSKPLRSNLKSIYLSLHAMTQKMAVEANQHLYTEYAQICPPAKTPRIFVVELHEFC
ncbi:hypothetical protein VTL71DRAFT_6419 [Oculimacula yallundae]|uniref:Uncharacterized protein n=1 Tax=Oculimacula yallundae TaxID=86028 RepID=A0ABR4BZJ4_9HELO